MLTRKQYELLMFIHERIRETGIPPSFDEMKDALDLKSKSGIHRLITALEERGFLRRMEKRARALEVLGCPTTWPRRRAPPPPAARRSAFCRPPAMAAAAPIRATPAPRRAMGDSENAVNVPLVGPHRRRHADRGAAEQDRRCAGARRHDRRAASITPWK